jgi:hypothetical protein
MMSGCDVLSHETSCSNKYVKSSAKMGLINYLMIESRQYDTGPIVPEKLLQQGYKESLLN